MRRFALLFVVLGMSLTVAAACGDDDDDDDAAPSPVATTSARTATPGAASPTTEAADDAADADAGDATVVVTDHPELGAILTDAEGRTLYRFDVDDVGVSNCYDQCEQAWPPLTSDGGEPLAGDGVPGALALHERTDGTMQVTYDDSPLYYFSGDVAAGDANGQGVGDVWFVIEIDGSARSTTDGGAVPARSINVGY